MTEPLAVLPEFAELASALQRYSNLQPRASAEAGRQQTQEMSERSRSRLRWRPS